MFLPVQIDTTTGTGFTDWRAESIGLTGIFWVSAGQADPANPENTYQRLTLPVSDKELTLEAIKRGGYTPTEQFEIRYCEQFFTPPSYASQYIGYVEQAAKSEAREARGQVFTLYIRLKADRLSAWHEH